MGKTEKILGVLGGLGPKATAYFFDLIVDNTVASKDQDHINAIYLNHATIPDRTEKILKNDYKELKGLLIDDVKLLESWGVSHIAIPCNTSHYFWDDLNDSVDIPVINMIEESIKYIKDINKKDTKRIGVLATDGTKETKLYERECLKYSIEVIYPSNENQKRVMNFIYDGVKSGKRVDFSNLEGVIEELRLKKCDAVILGCTELSVVYKNKKDNYIIDALYPLARKSIELSGKKVKD